MALALKLSVSPPFYPWVTATPITSPFPKRVIPTVDLNSVSRSILFFIHRAMDKDNTPGPSTGASINGASPIQVSSDDDDHMLTIESDATKWRCDQCQLLNPIQVLIL